MADTVTTNRPPCRTVDGASTSTSSGEGVGVGEGVAVGLGVGVEVTVGVAVGVAVGVTVGVAVGRKGSANVPSEAHPAGPSARTASKLQPRIQRRIRLRPLPVPPPALTSA
ncbi:MAG: hypothetical protein EXR52_03640 [Dehalococcoidia bacterium]|nr:hypothetical protein [Dehalococcoidia bacterium]